LIASQPYFSINALMLLNPTLEMSSRIKVKIPLGSMLYSNKSDYSV